MKSKTIIIVSILIICLLGFGYYIKISGIFETDYGFNTVFAPPPFSNEKFRSIKIGDTKEKVTKLLGKPMEIYNIPYENSIIYSSENYQLGPGSKGVNSSFVKNYNSPFIAFWFDKDKNVTHIFNYHFIPKTDENSFLSKKKENIITKFGKPRQEILVNTCYIYSYSKLKKGPQSGNFGGILVRRIIFTTNNKVKKLIEGNESYWSYNLGVSE